MPYVTMGSNFSIGDKVILDGDKEIVCVVTAIMVRKLGQQHEISWMHNGCLYTAWVDDWRLSLAEAS